MRTFLRRPGWVNRRRFRKLRVVPIPKDWVGPVLKVGTQREHEIVSVDNEVGTENDDDDLPEGLDTDLVKL